MYVENDKNEKSGRGTYVEVVGLGTLFTLPTPHEK